MKNTIVIFGGTDREEQEARMLCAKLDVATSTATFDGKPVHAGNAYMANGSTRDGWDQLHSGSRNRIILFECGKNAARCPMDEYGDGVVSDTLSPDFICDHHNPGDPGYGKGPEEFWLGSSIGQLWNILCPDGKPDKTTLMTAAGDHCPAAAYLGLCPGIDPVGFRKHRIDGLVTLTKKGCGNYHVDNSPTEWVDDNRAEIEAQIAFAESLLKVAPALKTWPDGALISGTPSGLEDHITVNPELLTLDPPSVTYSHVADMRKYGKIDQLPEAALISGRGYVSQVPNTDRDGKPDGRIKVNLGGNNHHDIVTEIMKWMETLPGTEKPYGVPARGFAGKVCPA